MDNAEILTLQTTVSYSDSFMVGCAAYTCSSKDSSQDQQADSRFLHLWLFVLSFILTLLLLLRAVPWDVSPSTQPLRLPMRRNRRMEPRDPTLEHAKNLIETHQEAAAIVTLKRFLASSPKPEDIDDAYLLMAAALVGKKEHEEALTYLNQLLAEFPASNLVGRARLMIGAAQLALGKPDAALSALSEAKNAVEDPETNRQALRMIGDLHMQKGDLPRAIQAWLEEMSLAPAEQRRESRERIKDLIVEKMDKKASCGSARFIPPNSPATSR